MNPLLMLEAIPEHGLDVANEDDHEKIRELLKAKGLVEVLTSFYKNCEIRMKCDYDPRMIKIETDGRVATFASWPQIFKYLDTLIGEAQAALYSLPSVWESRAIAAELDDSYFTTKKDAPFKMIVEKDKSFGSVRL